VLDLQELNMYEFNITAMTCGHCVGAVTQAVKQADPEAKVDVDLGTHKVRVESGEERETFESALTEAGYKPD
jgi:copper chaperone